MQSIAFVGSGGLLVLTGFVEAQALAIAAVTLSVGLSGAATAGCIMVYLDLSPHYSGEFFSVGNTIGNLAGIIAPLVAGQILDSKGVDGNSGRSQWRQVFYLSAAVYAVALVMWILWSKAKPYQPLN
eukprot:TRINITY_DN11019_c0_g1_i2.p2 TRINITY_DN11019_c0_g1~~TRINITY_DN11019_c0_g1_i2.p2  ORF type:complete len:127 (-),score=21.44 TRINITY_DN11019_c0_g1_i2:150-530(-)